MHIPHYLWMVRKDGPSPGILCQTLQSRGVSIPEWVWLPWIPQLLTSFDCTEARAVKAVMHNVVLRNPQAIYFSLRAFYLKRSYVEQS